MKKQLFLLLIILSTTTRLHAANFTWLGTNSSSWNLASNWSGSGGSTIPDSADHITISSSATNNLVLDQNRKISNLTLSSKTIDLNGYSLTVYGTATMTSGMVTNGTFYARGNLAAFNGTLMDCPVDADCGYIRFSGSTFNSTVTATDQGVATGTGAGGCTFNDDVTIIHGGNGTYFTFANTTGDVFNADLTVINYSSHEVHLSTTSSTQYKGNIVLNNTGIGGITFGNSGGTSTLDSGKTITIGSTGFTNDVLLLKQFTQLGHTAQALTLTGTAVASFHSSTFNGEITVSSPGILLKNSTFNGMSSFTKTGTSNAQSDGGNVFNGATTISNTGSSGRIRLATVSGDTYNANATFSSTGQDVQIAYSGDNNFAGNITINSNKVVFNTSTGKITFTGTNNQTLNGSYNYPFKKLAINKISGTVTANTTLSVDDSLIFIQGNLITTSTNLLTMKHGSTATGASNSSFVSGPLKKVGNTSFEYPVGKESSYLPLTISAPSTASSEFVAEYKIDSTGVNTGVKDSTLGYVFRDRYWTLNRTSGSSSVYVTLSWDGYYRLLDSIATTCYWVGSKWANLGQGTYSSTDSTGTMRTSNAINNFSEFTFAYKSIGSISGLPFSCSNIQTQGQLQVCLNAGAPICQITTNIDLIDNGPTGKLYLPINIPEGSVLQGYNSSNINQAWWQEGCRVLSTTKTTLYKTPLKNMFMFTMEPGATLQNLRLRGASCNFQDYNGDRKLCGGVYVGDDWGLTLTTTIQNCEIACFSYAGIFKSPRPRTVIVKNCYVHKVKANGNAPGLGYGCWAQGGFLDPNDDGNITYENVIFDDCKAAIDGQGYPNNWNINKCSFTQFFLSEDINMHNVDFDNCASGSSSPFNHSCISVSNCTGNIFWGSKCATNNCAPLSNCSGTLTAGWYIGTLSAATDIQMYDNGGANTTIENSIFHNYILKDKKGANISLNYPLKDHVNGNTSYTISILNSTFSTPLYDPTDILLYNNRGGYARVADNYIEACVWGTTFSRSGNTFSYKPGVTATPTQPCEVYLELIETGSTDPLPTTLNSSVTLNKNFTQWIDLSTDFRLSTTPGALGSQAQNYIIRPNPNQDIPAPFNGVVSNENYYYDGEIRTDQTSITIPGYTKPGLYGIDVLAIDAQSTSEYKSSAWQHIPLIVKPADNDNLKLYFNIKDSFKEFLGVSSTGVFKQVELNGYPIWREDIAEGGDGWENVVVDLTGDVLTPASGTIISKLNLDGTKNTITFSINVSSGTLSTGVIRGAIVWVDDIYIMKHSHPFGENLILDGSVENSSNADFKNTPSQQCSWYNPKVFTFPNCSTLRVASGANGEIDLDETLRYVDESPFKQISQISITSDANISNTERKSGNNSLSLILPAAIYEPSCATYPITAGENVVEVSTDIDVTELFDCRSFWDASTSSSALGFDEFPGFSTIEPNKKYYVDSDLEVNSGETWTIEGCQMVFAPGIQVVIHDGGRLNIQTTID